MPAASERSLLLPRTASREQAAAIVAAIERFMRASMPAAAPAPEALAEWQRAAILEGVSREPIGDALDPWINT
jgi:hypothetical protein